MRQWSIRTKVWAGIVVVMLLLVVAVLALLFFLYERLYVDKQLEMMLLEGEALVHIYETEGAQEYFQDRVTWANGSSEETFTYSEDPMVLASGALFEEDTDYHLITLAEREQLLQGETVVVRRAHPRFNQELLGVVLPLIVDERLEGVVFSSLPLADVYEAFSEVQPLLYGMIMLVIVAIAFVGHRVSRRLVDPLLQVKEQAKKMALGDLQARLPTKQSTVEFSELAHAINRLAQALGETEQNRRAFLADVAHELRTPLSYMKGYAEAVTEGVVKTEKGMAIVTKEVARMERLVHDLLDLAQLEGDTYKLREQMLVFAELIREVTATFALRAQQKEVALVLDLDETVIVEGDSDRLQQVIGNLLDNALTYSSVNQTITLKLYREGSSCQLVLADQGSGIPIVDLPAVTERFYRVHKGRSRSDGGTGLGLSIVSQIVAKHQGKFQLQSEEGKGTTAIVTLPMLK
ncbi:sensor histidine kinase [Shouchella lonarensis]|uniref:histidine kinase n=1 Tax=Shouchella lonarensis TaxID=1464122 RepID=A0A1G6PDU4_9BACI|nr:HAMP domain-containing sensor histidine kinase [Shouchella lonarensis]SDC77607.1 HAMP domain-containing protein [Shouchella lonarensis]